MVEREIFVFGSNLAGRHGKGAALHARKHHGAICGQAEGLQGQSYGIPTKDYRIQTLDLFTIRRHIDTFLSFARAHPDLTFNVTRIGCGLAGYRDEQIGPMFDGAPPNCRLPAEWSQFARSATPPQAQPQDAGQSEASAARTTTDGGRDGHD